MRIARFVAALVAMAAAGAQACGVCVDDKVAAAYDHEVVTRAAGQGHLMVFAEVRGRGAAGEFVPAARKAAARVRGVVPASVRAAESPAALSFALDPRVRSPEAALAAVEKGATAAGVKLALLKVVR